MPQDYIQANTGGRLHPADEPSISPLNRGFLYGDAIYEVWRTYHGVVFAWDEHWERLQASAAALSLDLPLGREELREQVGRTVTEFVRRTDWREDVYIRLQITRGGGPIGLDPALADRPDYVLLVQVNRDFPPEKMRLGLRLSLARELRRNDRRTIDPAWKTGNYLNNLLGLREARSRGADEVVMINLQDEITEAATSNVHFVKDGAVLTPALGSGLLAGVTRRLLVTRIAPAAGVAMREATLKVSDLGGLDECFLTSTTKDVTPVAAIDKHRFPVEADGVAAKLKAGFAAYAAAYAAGHPELRVL